MTPSTVPSPVRNDAHSVHLRRALCLVLCAVACGGSEKASGPTVPPAPVVAAVTVTPAQLALAVGSTTQFTAVAADSKGSPMNGQTFTWSSSASGVASVSTTGLVTGVATGAATITATVSGVAGTASVNVSVPNFAPTAATSLAGTLRFNTLNIPAGVTVTATSDVELKVDSTATIAGNLVGDCTRIRVASGGTLTVNGIISNVCKSAGTSQPDIRLVGKSLALTNDSISSAGDVWITNDTTMAISGSSVALSASAGSNVVQAAPSPVTRGSVANQVQSSPGCSITGGSITAFFGRDGTKGINGTNGADGRSAIVTCAGDLIISGGSLFGGNGGDGGAGTTIGSSSATDASGGAGGTGGRVYISANGNILFGSGVRLGNGNGGAGGSADALHSVTGVPANATGGAGGNAYGTDGGDGPIYIRSAKKITSSAVVELRLGQGGEGGYANASANAGNAAGAAAATQGGGARATAGAGGKSPGVITITGSDITGFNYLFTANPPPVGGRASAYGGRGGAGNKQFPNGAAGGDAFAKGGTGGMGTVRFNGALLLSGGNGGAAGINEGGGGSGFSDCGAGEAVAAAGSGGAGGSASGSGGTAGTGLVNGTMGTLIITSFGNGGAGGTGYGPGAGGAAGADGSTGQMIYVGSFIKGTDGKVCPNIKLTATWSVPPGGDPNGHYNYVLFQNVPSLTLTNPSPTTAPRDITITGPSPWVTITGTVAADGTITASGTGTVAGRTGVLVQFSGSFAGGTFTGTVIVGNQVPNTLPGGAITYSLTGPGASP